MSSAIDFDSPTMPLGRSVIGLAVIADQAGGRGEVHERTALLLAE
jgi:hypothetical protein